MIPGSLCVFRTVAVLPAYGIELAVGEEGESP